MPLIGTSLKHGTRTLVTRQMSQVTEAVLRSQWFFTGWDQISRWVGFRSID